MWTTVSISKGPEQDGVAGDLQTEFGKIIDQYEVKLEKTGGQYKASPQSSPVDNITVTPVNDTTGGTNYKGFKHNIQSKEVNRITVHGQAIEGIEELQDGNPISDKQFVYVYFPLSDGTYQRPLLICLSQNGQEAGIDKNKWYKRTNTGRVNTWTQDNAEEYKSIDPGTISRPLKEKLDEIKRDLNPAEDADTGYKKPELIVKLDYVAKSDNNTNAITYRTGDKQVTVTPITGTNFKGYKHEVGTQMTIDKVKIHGNEIGIQSDDLKGKQYVFVYYAGSDDDLQKPYLICLSETGDATGNNKWYKRQPNHTWREEGTLSDKNPNRINDLATNLSKIESELAEGGTDKGYTESDLVEIDISTTPTQENAGNGGQYMSGNITIQVTKNNVGSSSNWVGYKHSNSNTSGQFTLGKITHSDVTMTSTDGGLNANMKKQIERNGAIYVYYDASGNNLDKPKVICISTGNPENTSTNTWYKVISTTPNNWTEDKTNFEGKNPTQVTDTLLDNAAKSSNLTVPGGPNYVIKLDKRPKDNGIQYRTKDTITVTQAPINNVPGGYIAYEHRVSISGTNKIILQHNGNTLRDVTEDQPVTKIFVYYHKDNDREHQFPLIVCVDTGSDTRKYYKRGQTWDEAQNLANINPESEEAGRSDGPLKDELDNLKDIHEINLDKTGGPYKANADEHQITVAKKTSIDDKVPEGYVAYTHRTSNNSSINVKFKHFGNELRGLPESGVTIDNSDNKLWIYYKSGDMTKPLLIYVYMSTNDKWYHRGSKWVKTDVVSGDPNTTPSSSDIADKDENLFTGKLVRQGKLLELVCPDDMHPNSNYWNLYFIIQPYVDDVSPQLH